jgi:hypothetical protein
VLPSGDLPLLAREQASFGETGHTADMNVKRAATIAVGGAALAAWLAGAATSTRTPAPRLVISPPPIEPRGAELASEIAKLREHLRPSATPRQPGRNLFAYHTPAAAPLPPVAAAAPRPALTEGDAALTPPQPSLKLSGIAEDVDADGNPVRTAIIAGEGQLFMVKEGENVTSRYRVTKVSADVVELLDLATQTPRRLALR